MSTENQESLQLFTWDFQEDIASQVKEVVVHTKHMNCSQISPEPEMMNGRALSVANYGSVL